jgi:hypothetical protein
MDKPVVTQSAAWADLDNDGDLDLVLNNTNEYADVLENHADKNADNHWLRLSLQGTAGNPWGIGAKVWAYAGGQVFYLEQNPVRGFQSSVDPVMSLGLGKNARLDSLVIVWPNDGKQVLPNVAANQTLSLKIADATARWQYARFYTPGIFTEMRDALPFRHTENENNDLKKQSLMPWFYSRQGPALAVGDATGDGIPEIYLGGAKGQAGQLFQGAKGTAFGADAACEDIDAVFFDADGDGDQDLYVCSGGYEFAENDPALQDRLYRNDGRGSFSKAPLPAEIHNGTCVRAADVDGDGDQDLFVGGGIVPGKYPLAAPSRLLLNDGKGTFTPGQEFPGASDAQWLDVDGDRLPDLVTVGEWSAIRVYKNRKGQFSEQTAEQIRFNTTGMWRALHAADLDGDGDLDLVAGNLGNNTQLHASETEPLEIWFDDFDRNGSIDPLLFYYVQGKSYPLASMEDLTNQLPYLRKKFNYFKDYADAQVGDMLTPEQMKGARHEQAALLETIWLENKNGVFEKRDLPVQAQIAPVQAITTLDANGDGHTDLVLTGNQTHARVKLGSLDGNHGQLYLGDGKGGFRYCPQAASGLRVRGNVRGVKAMNLNGKPGLVFGVNDGGAVVFGGK